MNKTKLKKWLKQQVETNADAYLEMTDYGQCYSVYKLGKAACTEFGLDENSEEVWTETYKVTNGW